MSAMSQRKIKVSKLATRSCLRLSCCECTASIVVPLPITDGLQLILWKADKWVLSAAGIPGAKNPAIDNVLQPLCPSCQDTHMDPELLRVAREMFTKRYDGESN